VTSYQNSIHALRELIPSESEGGSKCACCITKLSHGESQLKNGIEYCLVEVTCDDGEQYGIQAFGKEAVQLHKEALKRTDVLRKEEEAAVSLVL
jgi:hypothetical protein